MENTFILYYKVCILRRILNKNSNYLVFETTLIIHKHVYDEILPKITHISFRLMPSFAENEVPLNM